MNKKLIKLDGGRLGIEFTNKEVEMWGIVEGDYIELDDMLVQKVRRKRNG